LEAEAKVNDDGGVAADQLRSFVERIERMEEEKAGIAGDIRDVYAEAKAMGFDAKILKRIISFRKKDKAEQDEEDALFEMYANALGLI
jgi:uncharacterized protein (UPF0335 family)